MPHRQILVVATLAAGLMSGHVRDSAQADESRAPEPDLLAGPARGPWRRLFLDAMVVEDQHKLEKVFHAAKKHLGNPVLRQDQPWEKVGRYQGAQLHGTVLWDEGKLRMWYRCYSPKSTTCYAESADGIHWTKPSLGLWEWRGSKDNNIVDIGQVHFPFVFKRPWHRDPNKRYALFCMQLQRKRRHGVAYSPDGLRWTFAPETEDKALFPGGDATNYGYDPYNHRYFGMRKGASPGLAGRKGGRGRAVHLAWSDPTNELEWTIPVPAPVLMPDDLDPDATQFYNAPTFAYQGMFIAQLWVFHARWFKYGTYTDERMGAVEKGSPCRTDVQLAWSWDLINWTRTPKREPFIALGDKGRGEFDRGSVYGARAPVMVGDRLHFYYGANSGRYAKPQVSEIGLATLRLDGFCSMQAGAEEGWLISRREPFRVPKITINAKTAPDGYVVAELLDRGNDVVPGFSRADCLPFTGDSVRHVLTWKTAELPEAMLKPDKKVRFYLKNADLYSYLPDQALGPGKATVIYDVDASGGLFPDDAKLPGDLKAVRRGTPSGFTIREEAGLKFLDLHSAATNRSIASYRYDVTWSDTDDWCVEAWLRVVDQGTQPDHGLATFVRPANGRGAALFANETSVGIMSSQARKHSRGCEHKILARAPFDTTDSFHWYRLVHSGGADGHIVLEIDGTELVRVPYTDLFPTTGKDGDIVFGPNASGREGRMHVAKFGFRIGSTAKIFRPAPVILGNVALSTECVVFGAFDRKDGSPDAEKLSRVPKVLDLGGKHVEARSATFDAKRILDLAPFIGVSGDEAIGKTVFVYIPFTAAETGPVTFGFGADWWYEAYLDGKVISETLSRTGGNGTWPPCIRDFIATAETTAGKHLLVVRFVSGKASSLLAVGGPADLRNPAIKGQARPKRETRVTRAGHREVPPAGRRWKLVWSEEFEGTTIDMDRWQIRSPGKPWNVPGIPTRYAEENCAVDGKGHLLIRLTRDEGGTVRFTRGINTRTFEKAYGYFETRVQFSTQPGWWTAVWLSGVPYGEGHDTFLFPQEFDIFEDFYKPKKSNDISHCYHATAGLSRVVDQGDGKGIGGNDMMARAQVGRVSKGTKVNMEQYSGWHTVAVEWTPLEHIFYVDGQETLRQTYRDVPITTVPQHVWCSGCLRTPKDEKHKPFYGRLEDATFPDQLMVDYVRVYDEDLGERTAPGLTLTLDTATEDVRVGQPTTFRIRAEDGDGAVRNLYLFSSGYIRAQAAADAPTLNHEFTITNLFPGDNTLIAMAKDSDGLVGVSKPLPVKVLTGREYTGTAFRGTPQKIPGRLVAGHYDEGGNGVALQMRSTKADPRLPWRTDEIPMSLETAIPVGASMARWVTYRVDVAETGDYEVELFMNRPDYAKRQGQDPATSRSETIRLDVDGAEAARWELSATWYSGNSWRQPIKPVGRQRVHLTVGLHQLIVDFGDVKTAHTNFGGFEFRKAE